MEAGEAAGALLFVLAVAAAVATGAVNFTYPATVGSSSGGGQWGAWLEAWAWVRSSAVAPALQAAVWACMVMSVMLVVEATYNCAVSIGVKLLGWKPEHRFKWEPLAGDGDEEKGDAAAAYPMVMIQIPMYNELEVYKLSIGAACELKWPKERLIVQVLDDSTDPSIKNLVEKECESWASKGVNVKYATRIGHKGFKAGALKKGMEWDYAKQCEYIALFDADYQPEPDFLLRTVPFLMHNSNVALVQARWVFGTAGVWRRQAINDAGGWKDRTTVEDMDLAVRATLKGWEFIYVGDVRVKSELPSTYQAYFRQQFRWACGSANLFRKMTWEVLVAKQVSPLKKFYMIYSFFLVRRVVAPTVAFLLYNIIIPVSVMIPEVFLPVWGVAYIPTALTVVTAIRNPELVPHYLHYSSGNT
ncbi:hypothetical protein C2845_PM02G24770 [Panicum miliaceum]|uniref:Glycosyltransferase 2-like domain-containing protein n=1 Tax=Panicum miliaceum TaxID=4540 RepID=A0A3L6SCT4_PANMI|nr:hypothetical protein C2845_PM02G24770 [Panicum miliaceum]